MELKVGRKFGFRFLLSERAMAKPWRHTTLFGPMSRGAGAASISHSGLSRKLKNEYCRCGGAARNVFVFRFVRCVCVWNIGTIKSINQHYSYSILKMFRNWNVNCLCGITAVYLFPFYCPFSAPHCTHIRVYVCENVCVRKRPPVLAWAFRFIEHNRKINRILKRPCFPCSVCVSRCGFCHLMNILVLSVTLSGENFVDHKTWWWWSFWKPFPFHWKWEKKLLSFLFCLCLSVPKNHLRGCKTTGHTPQNTILKSQA